MIPLMLRLENFMSYAELELDFSGMHLAVLTGANGAGKSSLLDAITYALWEKARATPEQLIRLGQSEMWVELTFELEGQAYRIFRRRTRRSGVGSQLEFHQRQGEEWVPLTGTSTRETQSKILQAVRMDYETFINSAFLRQGRADEFTTKTPQERKAVLAEILGLATYDALATRAREKWKAAQSRADALEHEQQELREALAAKDELDSRVDAARQALAALGDRLAAAELHQSVVRELAAAERLFEQAAHQAELSLHALESELAALDREVDVHAGLIQDRERIERAQAVLAAAREAESAHLEKARAVRSLEEQELALSRQWQQSQLQVEAARRELALRLERFKAEAAVVEALGREVAESEARLKAFEVAAVEQDRMKEKGFQYRAQQMQLKVAIERAMAAARAKAERLEALREPVSSRVGGCAEKTHSLLPPAGGEGGRRPDEGGPGVAGEPPLTQPTPLDGAFGIPLPPPGGEGNVSPPCPLCAQGLDGPSLGRVVAALRAEIQGHEDEANDLDHELAEVEQRLADSRARYAELAGRLKGREAEQLRLAELRARLGAAEAAASELEQLAAELASIPDAPEPPELLALRAELASIGYDPAELAVLQSRISDHRWADARGWQLEQAASALKRLDERRAPLVARKSALESAWLTEQEAHRARRDELLASVADQALDARAQEAALAELRAEELKRVGELGRLESEQQRLAALGEKLALREAEWAEAVADAQAFKELSVAFGKNGIQAILIENVIPELEEDANRLLARMTDNRMHVRLATQKEKKTGGVHETLEIYISDEVGTRNYELYSGGEAFRVNFALRLALSRLLARRAGAKLQTLIIDEGFGTQDERGREKLVEAISAVADEFARILVITHIRELKDAFNTQIEVVKRGGVSEVRAIA